MSNLIPLEDAARMLGLSVEKLNEMRSNSEIFGYKDGKSWKFKMQELERVSDEFDITINVGAPEAVDKVAEIADSDFELSLDDDDMSFELSDSSVDLISDDDSVEVEVDAEPVAESPVQDVIEFEDDDNFELQSDDVVESQVKSDSASELEEDSSGVIELGDEDQDKKPEDLSFGSSDIRLAGDNEGVNVADSADLLLDDEPDKGDPSTGKLLGDDDDGGDMLLSEDDLFEDDLEIQESHEDSIDLSSDFEDSSDLIMEDSDSSAEVELITDDNDSSEIDLSGSGLMELAGGEDEMIVLDDPAANDAPTELKDDDFNLTPLEEVSDEESSGSQIVALEDSEMYGDESAATLLSPDDESIAEPMLTEDALDVGDFGAFDAGVPGMAGGVAITPGTIGALPEQPYTVGQVVSLGLVLFLLTVGGMIGYDLARNLWIPDDQIISGGILKIILNLVGF